MMESLSKPWRCDNYRDSLSRELLAVEVLPVEDICPHQSNEACTCIPTLSRSNGVLMLVHNAFDGREINEAPESARHDN